MDPTLAELKQMIATLNKAEGLILDLPENWRNELMEREIDWLVSANALSDIADFLQMNLDNPEETK